jgi:hypothetical protein
MKSNLKETKKMNEVSGWLKDASRESAVRAVSGTLEKWPG